MTKIIIIKLKRSLVAPLIYIYYQPNFFGGKIGSLKNECGTLNIHFMDNDLALWTNGASSLKTVISLFRTFWALVQRNIKKCFINIFLSCTASKRLIKMS